MQVPYFVANSETYLFDQQECGFFPLTITHFDF